jgi:type IV secretory pathway VirB2 component (pilin)
MPGRPFASKTSLAAFTAIAAAAFSTAAFAHAGDHSLMTVAEMANHLLSSLDHRLTIVTVVLAIAAAGVSVLLVCRKSGDRSPGTPAT